MGPIYGYAVMRPGVMRSPMAGTPAWSTRRIWWEHLKERAIDAALLAVVVMSFLVAMGWN